MKKRSRSTRKSSAKNFLSTTPATGPASPVQWMSESPKPFEFNFEKFKAGTITPTSSKKRTGKKSYISSLVQLKPADSPASVKNLETIANLKEFSSSQLEFAKGQVERSHMEILKDLQASRSRLQKRLKVSGGISSYAYVKKRSRSTRKSSARDFLSTPPATGPESPVQSMSESPKPFEFNFKKFEAGTIMPTSLKRRTGKKSYISSPVQLKPAGSPASVKNLKTIADLKKFASSQLEFVKAQVERSDMEILKDLEASQSRLQKRLKIHTQGCQQVADEAEREYKKMSEQINEGREAMKVSYSTFMTELQASGARLFKQTIPELSQTVDKAIDTLKNRYGIHSTSAC